MQSGVSVVSMLINRALRRLPSRPLVVELSGHLGTALVNPSDARLHGAEALTMSVECRLHPGTLIEEARHLLGQSADLVRHDPDSLNRFVEVVSDIRIVIVLDFRVRTLRRITGLGRGLRDVREPRVEQSADVPQARDDCRSGCANDGDNRCDNRCDDLRVGDNVNHVRCRPTCPSAHRPSARPE